MVEFSTNAFRRFKSYIGELTAYAAGSYVAVMETAKSVDNDSSEDGWSTVAQTHSVCIKGLKTEALLASLAHLGIVSAYSGFDAFNKALREQYLYLHGKVWVQHDGDSPMQAFSRNLDSKADDRLKNLRSDLDCLEYYRVARNSIVHPGSGKDGDARTFYEANLDSLICTRQSYSMRTAPNPLSRLSFHDVKLLTRIELEVASAMDSKLDPGDMRLAELVPTSIRRGSKKAERKRIKAVGWLRTEFGVTVDRAAAIVSLVHELDG